MRFSIVIPNYNSEKWIIKLLDSIKNQTYKDYEIIIVDDISTDNSVNMIQEYIEDNVTIPIDLYVNKTKRFNGGTRNVGVENASGEYILFADCDDYFYCNNAIEEVAKVIDEDDYPDLIRLPYHFYTNDICQDTIILHENSLSELANTVFVAPWTKCIKRKLFIPFPENTLIEDIVQHIAQIDVIKTIGYCPIPVMVWNRANQDAISSDTRKYDTESKRYSSIFRNIADLLDLKCVHDYCKERRQQRLDVYFNAIHKGQEFTLINGGS